MKITSEELKAIYRNMSDEELLALDRGDLTEVALRVHSEELERRGFHPDGAHADPTQDEPMVTLDTFDSLDQVQAVEAVLASAGIPATLEDDTMRSRGFQVMVPASMADEARQVLKGPAAVAESDAVIVSARYENGVFVPVEDLEIREGALVEVHVPASDIM
jgi:hypothetical protein